MIGASLLEDLLAGKGVNTRIPGRVVIRSGEGTIKAGKDF